MPLKTVTTLTPAAIAHFRQSCIARGRSENTAKAYATDLKMFLQAVGESEVVMEEYEDLAASWLNMTRRDAAPKTTIRRLTSLRAFASWAKWPSVLEDYIAPKAGRPIPHPLPEGMDGVRRMIEVAEGYDQVAMVALGGFAGLRISEILECKVGDFDLETRVLRILGKGLKERFVPIGEEAWDYLAAPLVIASGRDSQRLVEYGDSFARQIIQRLGRKAELRRPVASHDLRSTFATELLNKTGNIRVVQELLGHASVTTTEGYTGVEMRQMREAVEF